MAHLPGGGNTTPPPPQRSAMLNFADASGSLTAAGQQMAQQIQAVLAQVAVSFPWIKWFQTVQQNLNNANDLALLAATTDESGGRAQIQAVIDVALAGVFGEPNERPPLDSIAPYLNDAQRPQSETVQFEANQRTTQDSDALLSALISVQASTQTTVVIQDTHAHRANFPAAAYKNSFYWETDRTLIYVSDGTNWLYVAGICYAAQSSIPNDFGASDAGALVDVTDYKHLLEWNGSAYVFSGGDASGFVVAGQPDGSAPNGGLWGLCDGSAYNVLKGDGTTASITTQNLTGDVFLRGGTAGAQQTAARATWETTAVTDDESAHTHQVTIANNAGTVLSGLNDVAAGQTVTSGAGSAHHHALSNSNAQLKVPNDTNGGVPLRISLAWYIRR